MDRIFTSRDIKDLGPTPELCEATEAVSEALVKHWDDSSEQVHFTLGNIRQPFTLTEGDPELQAAAEHMTALLRMERPDALFMMVQRQMTMPVNAYPSWHTDGELCVEKTPTTEAENYYIKFYTPLTRPPLLLAVNGPSTLAINGEIYEDEALVSSIPEGIAVYPNMNVVNEIRKVYPTARATYLGTDSQPIAFVGQNETPLRGDYEIESAPEGNACELDASTVHSSPPDRLPGRSLLLAI